MVDTASLLHSTMDSSLPRDRDFAKFQFGCEHYKRRCKIRAPCCNLIFPCRHCHNESANSLHDPKERHDLVRENVKQVVCSICQTQQEVAQVCSNCGVCMEEYFCHICKFFDDDTSKEQFHCDDCGICRVGGRDNFFHCQNCGACYATGLRDKHSCIENSTKNSCPVCYEISATEMHAELRVEVAILCNDCNKRSNALFHILGHKCAHCGSYNTRRISTPQDPVGDTE